jgi:hypothetical protein
MSDTFSLTHPFLQPQRHNSLSETQVHVTVSLDPSLSLDVMRIIFYGIAQSAIDESDLYGVDEMQ